MKTGKSTNPGSIPRSPLQASTAAASSDPAVEAGSDRPARNLDISPSHATKLSSLIRGHLARKKVSVSTVADGVIHVKIKGGKDVFDSVGIGNDTDQKIDFTYGDKHLEYLRIDQNKYEPHVVSDGELLRNVPVEDGSGLQTIDELAIDQVGNYQDPLISTNTSYFNAGRNASAQHPEKAPIGDMTTSGKAEDGGVSLDSVSPTAENSTFYRTVRVEGNGSVYTAAPVVAQNGKPSVTPEMMDDPRLKYPETGNIVPGSINHSEHPNPRGATQYPKNPTQPYRIALALQTTRGRGEANTGMTMREWSIANARLMRLNTNERAVATKKTKAGTAINHDGGPNAMFSVVDFASGEDDENSGAHNVAHAQLKHEFSEGNPPFMPGTLVFARKDGSEEEKVTIEKLGDDGAN